MSKQHLKANKFQFKIKYLKTMDADGQHLGVFQVNKSALSLASARLGAICSLGT